MKRVAILLIVLASLAIVGCGAGAKSGKPEPIGSFPGPSHVTHGKFATVSSPVVNEIFDAGTGQWSNSPTSFSYQWQDCNSDASSCSSASGIPTTTNSYTVVSGDVGSYLRVAVTATNAQGSAISESPLTGLVGGSGGSSPSNTAIPAISGVPAPAASDIPSAGTLSVSDGSWTNSPTSFTYQWKDCDATGASCSNATGSGATSNSYTVVAADMASSLRAEVTAHNASGQATSAAVTGPAPALWEEDQSPGDGTRDGNLYRMIDNNPPSTSYIDAVHAVSGSRVINLAYVEGENTATSQNGTNNICIDPAEDWTLASGDSGLNDPANDYFLYNSSGWGSGNRIFDSTFNIYLMDPGNTTWRTACASYNLGRTSGWHLRSGDGFFTDDVTMNPGQLFKSATGGYTNDAAYDVGLAGQMTYLTSQYNASGLINIPNISGTCISSAYETARENIVAGTDGSMEEGGPWAPTGTSGQPPIGQQDDEFVCKVGEGVYNEAHGKWWIDYGADRHTGSQTEPGYTFSLAAFLQEANGHSVFALGHLPSGGPPTTWYSELTTAMELGPAKSASYTTRNIGGVTVYERDFANGVAVVNPSQTSTSAFAPEAAGGTYTGNECNAVTGGGVGSCSSLTNVSTVTLGADGGAIFLKTS